MLYTGRDPSCESDRHLHNNSVQLGKVQMADDCLTFRRMALGRPRERFRVLVLMMRQKLDNDLLRTGLQARPVMIKAAESVKPVAQEEAVSRIREEEVQHR